VSIGENQIAPDDISFYSPWRKRTLTLTNGASPVSLLTDIALTSERAGESLMDRASMQEFGFIDSKESKDFLNDQAPSNPSYKENIVYPKPGTQDVTVKEVDLGPLYTRMGTTMYPPAFREFALAPIHWLYTPDKEAEDYIAAQLALTYEQKLQAERTIRISHNHAKLSRLLTSDQLPMTEARMRGLCRAISAR
jgi:hypothetical protein